MSAAVEHLTLVYTSVVVINAATTGSSIVR
jgi:hypothetical protein